MASWLAMLIVLAKLGSPAHLGQFALGLAMTAPFVVAALFARPFLNWMQRNRGLLAHVEKVMGVMLIIFAVLIATNTINIIANAMIEWFPVFTRIG